MSEGRAATLIYDGDCRFCRRCIALLRRWDRPGRLAFVPLQDGAGLAGLPVIPREALEQAMHLVTPEGEVYAGARAAPPLLKMLPGGGLLAALFRMPGIPRLADRVYRTVARNRHRLGCGSAACHRGAG